MPIVLSVVVSQPAMPPQPYRPSARVSQCPMPLLDCRFDNSLQPSNLTLPPETPMGDDTISHELRTPLTAIRAALGLLQSGKVHPNSDLNQHLVRIAASNTQRLLRFTEALEADYSGLNTTAPNIDLDRLRLEADLYAAWEQGQFAVFYQPIVCMRSHRIVSLEALIRWHHPQRGNIPPSVFIPLAEEMGLIAALGEWVIEQACTQLRYWQEQFPCETPLAISVNLSPQQLLQPDLAERIGKIIWDTRIAPGSLHLEITESALIDDSELAIEVLRRLKSLGIPLYLDDFGTGYSSLSRLHELTVDVLKVDRTFVARQQWSLIRGILHLAVGLGLEVVVEGIETEQELERARHLGCHRCQGYHFAKPSADRDVTALLAQSNYCSLPAIAAR